MVNECKVVTPVQDAHRTQLRAQWRRGPEEALGKA